MSAPIRKYYDYDGDASISCPKCGWTGTCSDHEDYFSEVLDIRCGSCDTMLLIVSYPSPAQTSEAAARGNEKAKRDLAHIEELDPVSARTIPPNSLENRDPAAG